jgi:hypothetical protein
MEYHNHWHPTWHKPEHAMQWDRVKEAVRRDWQQTKHDLHVGGHQLGQSAGDTIKQASGREDIPPSNDANPQNVASELRGEWEMVAHSVEYGCAARHQFGSTHPEWDDVLDHNLRVEWESAPAEEKMSGLWVDVKPHVRHGYNYRS